MVLFSLLLAMVVAGLIIGNHGRARAMSDKTHEHLDMFWELLDSILNAVLFVLIGLEVILIEFSTSLTPAGSRYCNHSGGASAIGWRANRSVGPGIQVTAGCIAGAHLGRIARRHFSCTGAFAAHRPAARSGSGLRGAVFSDSGSGPRHRQGGAQALCMTH